jgi:hypothetical protein
MTNTSLRLDHSLTSRVSLFARYGRSPSRSEFGSSQVNNFSAKFASFTLGMNARLGARVVNDLRSNFVHGSADSAWTQENSAGLPQCYFSDVVAALSRTPQDCNTFFRLSVGGLGQLVSGREAGHRQRQWNVTDTAHVNGGSHAWRFGFDYRRIAPERLRASVSSNIMVNNIEDLLNTRNTWVTSTRLAPNRLFLSEASLFLQDTWRMHSRLTLTYGARWEWAASPGSVQTPKGLQLPKPNPFAPPMPAEVWGSRYDNVAPRVGLALQLSRSRHTILRAGAGAYYESSLSIATDLLNDSPQLFWQLASPVPDVTSPTQSVVNYGFEKGLRLPKVWQWNMTLEQPFGKGDIVSAAYVGSRGLNLLRREMDGVGGVAMVTNHGSSNYHALQLQWRRRMARYAPVSASYSCPVRLKEARLCFTTDTGAWQKIEKPLFSKRHGLAGKPDYIVEQNGSVIPVEVKHPLEKMLPASAHLLCHGARLLQRRNAGFQALDATGKPSNHIATSAACETCHRSTRSWDAR